MRINKLLSYAVLVTAGFLHLGGLSAVDLKTMAQRQSSKQKVLADIRNGNWADAASGIQQFENANIKRFAIDLRQAFANAHSTLGALPANWPSSLQKREDRSQAKATVVAALEDGNFTSALAGIQKLPETTRRELYKTFVMVAVNTVSAASKSDIDLDDLSEQLIVAAENGELDQVQALLKAGADVNAAKVDGYTALMAASNEGHEAIVQLLLTAGANTDLQDNDGDTALILAAYQGHLAPVQLLLGAGANKNLTDNDGKTAYDSAKDQGHDEVMFELR